MTGFRRAEAAPPPDPRIQLIGRTQFLPPTDVGFATDADVGFATDADVGFETDADDGSALAEFAGRACYQSWNKPNPATADNAGFVGHIIDVGHLSVLEHSSATFYLTGISRSVTHEILRHRHFSYSELSPRYLPAAGLPMVEPPAVAADPGLHQRFVAAADRASAAQAELLEVLEGRAAAHPDGGLVRKQARQIAQSLLPGSAATAVVMTGNYRAWRHFIGMRATDSVDVEIRSLAVGILDVLQREAPAVFADFRITALPDGTRLAASPLVGEG